MRSYSVPRTIQPQHPVRVNQDHPLFKRGLRVLIVPGVGPGNLIDGVSVGISPNGVASRGRTTNFSGLVSTSSVLSSVNFSVVALFRTPASLGSQECIFGRGQLGTNNNGFGFHATHANATYAGALYAGSGYTVIGKPTGGALAASTEYSIGLTYDGTNGRGYSNGVLTTGPTAVSSATINTAARLAINANSDVADASTCGVYAFAFFDQGLTSTEIAPLLGPRFYELLEPIRRRFFVGDAGTPSTGSLIPFWTPPMHARFGMGGNFQG